MNIKQVKGKKRPKADKNFRISNGESFMIEDNMFNYDSMINKIKEVHKNLDGISCRVSKAVDCYKINMTKDLGRCDPNPLIIDLRNDHFISINRNRKDYDSPPLTTRSTYSSPYIENSIRYPTQRSIGSKNIYLDYSNNRDITYTNELYHYSSSK